MATSTLNLACHLAEAASAQSGRKLSPGTCSAAERSLERADPVASAEAAVDSLGRITLPDSPKVESLILETGHSCFRPGQVD